MNKHWLHAWRHSLFKKFHVIYLEVISGDVDSLTYLLRALDDKSKSKFGISNPYGTLKNIWDFTTHKSLLRSNFIIFRKTYNLQIWNADVEALVHVGMPHDPHVSDKKGSKITLKHNVMLNVKTSGC